MPLLLVLGRRTTLCRGVRYDLLDQMYQVVIPAQLVLKGRGGWYEN
jgi:hypothetical protein